MIMNEIIIQYGMTWRTYKVNVSRHQKDAKSSQNEASSSISLQLTSRPFLKSFFTFERLLQKAATIAFQPIKNGL